MASDREARAAVLGLDGLSREYLERVIDAGLLPYYKHVYQRSLVRDLDCFPPITPPSWASIMSGVNPGKHGVFDFIKLEYVDGSWRAGIYNALDLKHPRIHEMIALSNSRLRSLVINPMPDNPLIPVRNSVVINTLFFTPQAVSYPRGYIEKHIGSEGVEALNGYLKAGKETPGCMVVEAETEALEIHLELLENSLASEVFNLVWVNLNVPDHVFHKCPKAYSDPRMLSRVFGVVDKIARLLSEYAGNLTVVSDHGFKRYKYYVNVNEILRRAGLLKESPTGVNIGDPFSASRKGGQARILRIPPRLYFLIKHSSILTTLGRKVLHTLSTLRGARYRIMAGRGIDYTRSEAFLPVSESQNTPRFYVYVRNPKLIDNAYKILASHENLEVYKATDIFNGPYTGRAPPIIVAGKGEYFVPAHGPSGKIEYPADHVNHHRLGILATNVGGEGISTELSRKLPNPLPNAIVAPMIMCKLGVPTSSETDYKPLITMLCSEHKMAKFNYISRWRVYLSILKQKEKIK